MVNLEEIRGEHKKLYKTPDMEIVYLTWADIVTSSPYSAEGGGNDLGGDNEHDPDPTANEW